MIMPQGTKPSALTEFTGAIDENNDQALLWDSSASVLKRMSWANWKSKTVLGSPYTVGPKGNFTSIHTALAELRAGSAMTEIGWVQGTVTAWGKSLKLTAYSGGSYYYDDAYFGYSAGVTDLTKVQMTLMAVQPADASAAPVLFAPLLSATADWTDTDLVFALRHGFRDAYTEADFKIYKVVPRQVVILPGHEEVLRNDHADGAAEIPSWTTVIAPFGGATFITNSEPLIDGVTYDGGAFFIDDPGTGVVLDGLTFLGQNSYATVDGSSKAGGVLSGTGLLQHSSYVVLRNIQAYLRSQDIYFFMYPAGSTNIIGPSVYMDNCDVRSVYDGFRATHAQEISITNSSISIASSAATYGALARTIAIHHGAATTNTYAAYTKSRIVNNNISMNLYGGGTETYRTCIHLGVGTHLVANNNISSQDYYTGATAVTNFGVYLDGMDADNKSRALVVNNVFDLNAGGTSPTNTHLATQDAYCHMKHAGNVTKDFSTVNTSAYAGSTIEAA